MGRSRALPCEAPSRRSAVGATDAACAPVRAISPVATARQRHRANPAAPLAPARVAQADVWQPGALVRRCAGIDDGVAL